MKECKKFRAVLSLLFLFLNLQLMKAQNADEIINRHLQNSGGISNWRNLNSIIIKGDVLLSLEQSYPIIIYHKRPYQKKVVFLINGKEMLNEGYDGKNGWTYNEISAKNEKLKSYKPDSFEDDLLDYRKKGFTARYTGTDHSEGQSCYRVELTKNVNRPVYCFSTEDYSLVWEQNDDEKLFYYDYKKFDGLSFATRIVGRPNKGGEYVLKFNSIQINPHIDDKEFKF